MADVLEDGTSLSPVAARSAALIGRVSTEGESSTTRREVNRIAAFFCLCTVVLMATGHLVNVGLRRVPTSDFGVWNRIVNGEINTAVVISGSSRALTHYDPRVIQAVTGLSAFNIGLNGSQTDMQLAALKTYLRHNSRPDLLVHNLDTSAFETSRHGVYFPGQYVPYMDEAPIYEAFRAVDPDAWKTKYLPLYGYAVEDMNFTWLTGIGGLLGLNPKEDHFLGFRPRNTAWTADFERFRKRNPNGVRYTIEDQGLRDFEQLMQVCKERQIPVLLVYSPEYYEMQKLTRNRTEVFEHFRDIATRYQATIWDYSESPISFRTEYFYNSQHLNADGAAVFSMDLALAMKRSGLLKARE
jgi:hypothetical protein